MTPRRLAATRIGLLAVRVLAVLFVLAIIASNIGSCVDGRDFDRCVPSGGRIETYDCGPLKHNSYRAQVRCEWRCVGARVEAQP